MNALLLFMNYSDITMMKRIRIQRKYDLSSKWFLKSILLLLSGSKTNVM